MNHRQSKIKKITLSIALTLTISACDNDDKKPIKTTAEKVIGIWEQPGYGNTFVVTKESTTEYEFTGASCLKLGSETGRFGMTEEDINKKDFTFSNNDAEFLFAEKHEPFAVRLKRLTSLPESCQTNLVENTPVEIFNHYWNTFNDYYAFNTERGIDWSERYTAVINSISNDMTDEELFVALSETISPVDDSHTFLESDEDDYSPAADKGYVKQILDSFQLQTEFTDIEEYVDAVGNKYNQILGSYIKEDSYTDGERLSWGITHERVGLIKIDQMVGYSSSEDLPEEIAALDTLLDQVMTDLKDTPAIIIDVRFNGGGTDGISLAIANRFTDQHQEIMSKTARSFNGETTPVKAYLNPHSTPYLKPVVVIAGASSTSAAEIFLIAMKQLQHVTLVGEASNGATSDELSKELPNGWSFGLSNEVYLDNQGNSYEVTGVQPDISAPVYSADDLENNRNSAIEAALVHLGVRSN